MIRATADTNIYISAFNFGGTPEVLLRRAYKREIQLAVSNDILNEMARILRNKFNWPAVRIDKT